VGIFLRFVFFRSKNFIKKVVIGKGDSKGGGGCSLFMAQLGWSKKAFEASFSQNELKDMPGQSLYMHTGLNFHSIFIHTIVFGFFFVVFSLKKLPKILVIKNGD